MQAATSSGEVGGEGDEGGLGCVNFRSSPPSSMTTLDRTFPKLCSELGSAGGWATPNGNSPTGDRDKQHQG